MNMRRNVHGDVQVIEKGLVLTLKSLVKKAAVGWIFCLALMWMMAAACAAAVSTPVPKADRNSFKIVKVRSTGVVISMSLGETDFL